MSHARRIVAVLVAAALTAACTGGGADSGSDDAADPADCDVTTDSDAVSQPAATTAPPPSEDHYTTANTPIGTLTADPEARAVVERHLPDLVGGGFLDLIAHTSLKGIQGYAASVLTDEVLAEIDAELAAITPLPPEDGGGPVVGDVNFDEARVGSFELPAALTLASGAPVCDEQTWWSERRPEIYDIYETLVYGRSPGAPADQYYQVTEAPTPAFDGAATRTQVRIHLAQGTTGPSLDLVEYVPTGANGPVPMLLVLGFGSPGSMFGDPGLTADSPGDALPGPVSDMMSTFPTAAFLEAGFGVAGIDYLQADPDDPEGYAGSVRAYFDQVDEADRPPDAWGAVAAWGWGLSRALDYLETDPSVDAERVAIYGASRLGRAVLWAGARDQRFAAVISCCSGRFGGALLRRDFGEALDSLPAHWFAPNLAGYLDRIDELPVDAHLLLALIAPRPVLLQTGRYDHGADPKGEFLAAAAAEPVYELLGADDLEVAGTAWPPEGPVMGDVGYLVHDGGHGTAAEDWNVFLDFLEGHLDDG